MYSAADLHKLRFVTKPPPLLLNHPDLVCRPKYIHRGSCRNIRITSTNSDYSGHSVILVYYPKTKNAGRSVDHEVLTPFPRSDYNMPSALHFGLFNVRSLNNKTSLIHELIEDQNIDFMCVTETWQKPNDYFYLNQTVPSGYEYISKPRYSGKGGGLALIYRDRHKVCPISLSEPSTFEILAVQLKGPTPTVLVMIYRPPKASTMNAFFL